MTIVRIKRNDTDIVLHTFSNRDIFQTKSYTIMNNVTCSKNITACVSSMDLRLCDIDKDICLKRGWCITSMIPSNISVCVCHAYFYGDHCENEVFSGNLWSLCQRPLTAEMNKAFNFFVLFFSTIQLINSILCFQTYFFSRKIRLTNVGVHLIFHSIIWFLVALKKLILFILMQFIGQLPDRYLQIQCLIDNKFVLISLLYIGGWSLVFVAFERMLVECYHYSLFDSRRRSCIISILVTIICPLTTIPGIFTMKNLPTDQLNVQLTKLLKLFSCVNYSSSGYTIFKVTSGIHGYATLFSYLTLSLIVLAHLMRHRRRVAPQYTILQNMRIALRRHRDFFLVALVPVVFGMPLIVLNEMMTCSKALDLHALPSPILFFAYMLGLLSLSLPFLFHVYPAEVYMVAFWNESPVGRLLRFLKRKIIQIMKRIRKTRQNAV